MQFSLRFQFCILREFLPKTRQTPPLQKKKIWIHRKVQPQRIKRVQSNTITTSNNNSIVHLPKKNNNNSSAVQCKYWFCCWSNSTFAKIEVKQPPIKNPFVNHTKTWYKQEKNYMYNKLVEEAPHWTPKLLAPGPANVFLIRFFFVWFRCCQRWFHFNPYNCHFVANELNRKISFDNFLSGKSSRELWLHTKHGMKLMMEEESSSAAQFRRFLHSQIGLMLRNAKTPKGR